MLKLLPTNIRVHYLYTTYISTGGEEIFVAGTWLESGLMYFWNFLHCKIRAGGIAFAAKLIILLQNKQLQNLHHELCTSAL